MNEERMETEYSKAEVILQSWADPAHLTFSADKAQFVLTVFRKLQGLANSAQAHSGANMSLREMQVNLPWTIRYSRDFRASPATHKDFAHALHHVSKAAGHLHALADDMDHDRQIADDPQLRERYAKYVADLVVCALRISNTFPGGVVDLQSAVLQRIETKNGVSITEKKE